MKALSLVCLFFSFSAQSASSTLNSPEEPGYDILIIAGQSNAVGRAISDVDPTPRHLKSKRILSKVFQVGRYGDVDRKIIPAQEPLHHHYGSLSIPKNNFRYGFAYSLALRIASKLPDHRKLLIVPAAKGSTSIIDWSHTLTENESEVTTTHLYYDMLKRLRTAFRGVVPGATRATNKNRVIGFVWQQGEADVWATVNPAHRYHNFTNENIYESRLRRLITITRNVIERHYDTDNSFPFLVGRMAKGFNPTLADEEVISEVRDNFVIAQDSITTRDRCAGIISTNGLSTIEPDKKIHFDVNAIIGLGNRYFVKFMDLYESCRN